MRLIFFILFPIVLLSQNNTYIIEASIPQIQKFVYVQSTDAELSQSGSSSKFVTTTGNSSNTGDSEAQSWSMEHALATATAGTTVWVKAGLYTGSNGNVQNNNGTFTNSIKFIGYKNSPGDIVSLNTSTFKRTNTSTEPDPAEMPVFEGLNNIDSIGFEVFGNYVSFQNIIVTKYFYNIFDKGLGNHYKNIVSGYSNKGIHFLNETNGGIFENFFVLNCDSEALNIKGNFYEVRNGIIWSDNFDAFPNSTRTTRLTAYYALTGSGAHDNVWKGITIVRPPSDDSQHHQGHGIVLKQDAFNNIYDHTIVINTGIELNYSGVYNNTISNFELYGSATAEPNQFGSMIRILNGAHDNYFFNGYLQDVRYGIELRNWDDGLQDTATGIDENQGGNNNVFKNLRVNKAQYAFISNDEQSGATSDGNTIQDSHFYNITIAALRDNMAVTNTNWINTNFDNINGSNIWVQGNGVAYDHSFDHANFINTSFANPSGTSITNLPSSFVGPLNSPSGFNLDSNSALRGIGKNGNDIGYQLGLTTGSTAIKAIISSTTPLILMN